AVLPEPSQSTVRSAACVEIDGAVTSSIVKVAVEIDSLPQASVAMNSTVTDPDAPQRSLSVGLAGLVDQVSSLQSSVAVIPPWLLSQSLKALVLPEPSQSTVISSASLVIKGATSSVMVNIAVVGVAFPHSSVAVKVTVTDPVNSL